MRDRKGDSGQYFREGHRMLDENSVAAKAQVSNNGLANYESGREYLFVRRRQLTPLSMGALK